MSSAPTTILFIAEQPLNSSNPITKSIELINQGVVNAAEAFKHMQEKLVAEKARSVLKDNTIALLRQECARHKDTEGALRTSMEDLQETLKKMELEKMLDGIHAPSPAPKPLPRGTGFGLPTARPARVHVPSHAIHEDGNASASPALGSPPPRKRTRDTAACFPPAPPAKRRLDLSDAAVATMRGEPVRSHPINWNPEEESDTQVPESAVTYVAACKHVNAPGSAMRQCGTLSAGAGM